MPRCRKMYCGTLGYRDMEFLLDTHAFLWWDSQDPRLPEILRSAIESSTNTVYVSAATVWEIAIERASGKLIFGQSVARAIEQQGFQAIPITIDHTEWAGSLPPTAP